METHMDSVDCVQTRTDNFVYHALGDLPYKRLCGKPDFVYGETLYYDKAPQDCIIYGFHLQPLAAKLGVEARMDVVLETLKKRGWATALVD